MQPQILVVSDPPHGEVDIAAMSNTLGLDEETTRLKVAFPAPEILAASGPQRAHDIAEELRAGGLHTRVIAGDGLAALPWSRLATDLSFGEDALEARVHEGSITIPYSASMWAVSCMPPSGFSKESKVSLHEAMASRGGPTVAEALEWTPHLDLYAVTEEGVGRLSIVEAPRAALEEFERRFHRVGVDRRLDGVRPRQRFVAGEAGFDIDLRKAFSFGTLLLRQVLQSVSEELRDLPQYEYASRLSFATRPGAREP
ncbi:MAG: hypothetical protein HKO77_10175 [Gemmatimonadetes bacterium]|nr:hypothetical protein [Gemmatimonadota bacterium]